jgi:hypothetical protein
MSLIVQKAARRPKGLAWAMPALMAAGSLGAALSLAMAPPAQGPVAALFPPWWSGGQAFLAASQAGPFSRFGAWRSIVIVLPEGPAGIATLRRAGAWAVLNPEFFGGCGAAGPLR